MELTISPASPVAWARRWRPFNHPCRKLGRQREIAALRVRALELGITGCENLPRPRIKSLIEAQETRNASKAPKTLPDYVPATPPKPTKSVVGTFRQRNAAGRWFEVTEWSDGSLTVQWVVSPAKSA